MCSFRYVSFSHKIHRGCCWNFCYTPAVLLVAALAFSCRTFLLTSNHLFKALFSSSSLLLPHTLKLLALLVTPISSVSCSFHRANFRIASILMPSNRPTLLQLIEYIFCYPREEESKKLSKWSRSALKTGLKAPPFEKRKTRSCDFPGPFDEQITRFVPFSYGCTRFSHQLLPHFPSLVNWKMFHLFTRTFHIFTLPYYICLTKEKLLHKTEIKAKSGTRMCPFSAKSSSCFAQLFRILCNFILLAKITAISGWISISD